MAHRSQWLSVAAWSGGTPGVAAGRHRIDLDTGLDRRRQALRGRGQIVEGDLQATLKAPRPEGQRARVEQLLSKLSPAVPPTGNMLRGLRCIWLLERIGTPDANKLLETMAGGANGSRVTIEATAALERLAK
jgi:hypothetical protein